MKIESYLPKLGIVAGAVAIARGAVLRSLVVVVMGVALVMFSAYKLWRGARKSVDATSPPSPPGSPRRGPAGPEHIVYPPPLPEPDGAVPPAAAVPPVSHAVVPVVAPAHEGPKPSAAPPPVALPALAAVPPPAVVASPDPQQELMNRTRVTFSDGENFKQGAETFATCPFPFFFQFADCGSNVAKSSHDRILATAIGRCFHSILLSFDVRKSRFSTIRYKSESSNTGIQADQLNAMAPNGRYSSSARVLNNFREFGDFLFEMITASQVPVVISSQNNGVIQYNYCILGVKKPAQTTSEEQTRGLSDKDFVLLIADPHKSSLEEAIYSVRFGLERTTGRIMAKDCSAEDRRGSIESIQALLSFPSFDWEISFLKPT